MSTKVRKLSMDEYQTKYKYNDSAYLRDINTEVSIESKYYKDFFTRLNRVRDFHMTEDTKPRTGLIKKALSTIHNYKYGRKDLVVVGVNSGYQNQSNVDKLMALNAKIDYVDVNELLTSYC